MALWEFLRFFPCKGGIYYLTLGEAFLITVGAYVIGERGLLLTIFFSLFLTFAWAVLRIKDVKEALPSVVFSFFGLFYISALLSYLLFLDRLGREYIIFLLILIWGIDTFAYYTGRRIGKRKLAPVISPSKTLEGAVGGFLGGVLISFVAGSMLLKASSPIYLLSAGAGVGLIGQMGDLAESLYKRWAGVKDSSHLIPGHGGILDRIDSLLLSIPFFYYLNLFFGKM